MLAAFAVCAVAGAQGGLGGFGGQGAQRREMNNEMQSIDGRIGVYLNGDEVQSVLTPGEYCEWPLVRKAGQVVFAEARSDAFDPALEVLDENNKVLAQNDDRYPGDQRPLLMWRCEKDGAYKLHLRCFRDKAGGQGFVRFKTYDSVDVPSDQKVEQEIESRTDFLVRIPMKAGQIKEILFDRGGDQRYLGMHAVMAISPSGLPDINLSDLIQPITGNAMLVAPVDGDYYIQERPEGYRPERAKVRIWTREIVPQKITESSAAQARTGSPVMWEISVKKGELLEASATGLNPYCATVVCERPDFSKYDVSKDDTNPFYPHLPQPQEDPITSLPGRARDNRISVFYARRDANLWLASNGAGPEGGQFSIRVKPAGSPFPEGHGTSAKLQVANTDYWVFDANAGDVMTFHSKTSGYVGLVIMRDPDMNEIQHDEANVDQSADEWRMVVAKQGRYVVSMSCLGGGGGGSYDLSRQSVPAKVFGIGNPVTADISKGDLQIWKLTVAEKKPVLMHFTSSNWGAYGYDVRDDQGHPVSFGSWVDVDRQNHFGILKVQGTRTFVVILSGNGAKAHYSIEVNPIPGYNADK